jgi:hypothetical protein
VLDDIGDELDEEERASAAEGLRLWGEAMRRRWYRRAAAREGDDRQPGRRGGPGTLRS